jgi:hypothetical protein
LQSLHGVAAQAASGIGRAIAACDYPPDTSKGTKVEHRLLSHISRGFQPAV